MIKIAFEGFEGYCEDSNSFITLSPCTLCLEHSLIAIRKWEAKWHKPFLIDDEKSNDQWADYIRCMILNEDELESIDVDQTCQNLSQKNLSDILQYIENPSTATWFRKEKDGQESGRFRKKEILTAEVIYYHMINLNIPVEFEKWHLNQLVTLIRVFGEMNKPRPKRSEAEIAAEWASLNKARLEAMKSGR